MINETNKKQFKKVLLDYVTNLAIDDIENQRSVISDLSEFIGELTTVDFKEQLEEAFEYYQDRYRSEFNIAHNLPGYVEIDIKDLQDHISQYDSMEEAIGEYLSDDFGFCHNGFLFEIDNNIVKVSDIDWDYED